MASSADEFSRTVKSRTENSLPKDARRSIWGGIILAFCSAGLFALSMPGRPCPWLAWLAMVPILFELRIATPLRGFFLAGLFAWLMWFTSVWWLQAPLRDIAGMSLVAAAFVTMAGCLLMALPYALAGAIICRWRRSSSVKGAARDAAIFTLAITWLTPVFQGSPAHSQYLYPIILQVLELGGAPLLLFLMLWVNFLIGVAVFNYRKKTGAVLKPAVFALGIIGLIVIYGAIRLHQFDVAMKSAPPEQWFNVGSVQPNIPISVSSERQPDSGAISNNFFSAMEQARELAQQHPEINLLALPENPATFVFNRDAARRLALGQLIKATGKPVLLNVDAIDSGKPDDGGAERYNVAVLVDTNRNLVASYRKIKRLPLVEYIPGEKIFPSLRKWFPKSLRVLEGPGPTVLPVKSAMRVIPLICYESTISSLARQFVQKLKGNVIVNQVDDSWFLRTSASEIHLALSLFRTVEFRVPLVRVTNSGIGAHIQADGKIVPGSRTALFTKAATAFPLYVPSHRSLYANIGNYWMLGFIFLLPIPRLKKFRHK